MLGRGLTATVWECFGGWTTTGEAALSSDLRCRIRNSGGCHEGGGSMETTSVIGTKNNKGQVYSNPRVMMNEAPRTPSFFTGSEVIKEAVQARQCGRDGCLSHHTSKRGGRPVIGELFAKGYVKRILPWRERICSDVADPPVRHSAVPVCSPRRLVPAPCEPWKIFRCGPAPGCRSRWIVTCRGINSPLFHSARHVGDLLPTQYRHAGLARGDGAGLL